MTTIAIPWADKTLNRVCCSIRDAREEKVIDVSFTTEGAALGFWNGLAPDGSPLLLRNQEQSDVYVLSLARP